MKYNRVLPRDAFNDANLLKCIGKITLDIEDGNLKNWQYHFDGDNFEILQNENDGSTFVSNITFWYKSQQIELYRPLNSREDWPLMAIIDGEYCDIFDEHGNVQID